MHTEKQRPRTRRRERVRYRVEPVPAGLSGAPPDNDDPATAAAQLLGEAGALVSALRTAGFDVPTARLVLTFPTVRHPLGVSDVAWRMGLTPGAASRLLDRAEEQGLVDKLYGPIDRRTTSARLTAAGRSLRSRVEEHLCGGVEMQRARGIANGTRDYLEAITPPGGLRGYRVP
jgi:DNA-binding MarR family transcriptional regulator